MKKVAAKLTAGFIYSVYGTRPHVLALSLRPYRQKCIPLLTTNCYLHGTKSLSTSRHSLADTEIASLLCTPNIPYCVHKGQTLDTILGYISSALNVLVTAYVTVIPKYLKL